MCAELRIECIEKVSHTLWDPMEIIILNGGTPPLTYDQFVVSRKFFLNLLTRNVNMKTDFNRCINLLLECRYVHG